MAFPTTSLLANFNWADEDPLVHGFVTPLVMLDYNAATISNVADNTHGWASAYYNSTFNANVEVYAKIVSPSVGHDLYWRVQNPNSATLLGYSTAFRTDDTIVTQRITNNTSSQIGSSTATITTGDQVGVSHVGDTIRFYVNGTEVGTPLTESTNAGAGFVGFRQFVTHPVDDFGGGNYGGGASSGPYLDAHIGA